MPYKHPTSEPVAIVGSSCRFAGGATTPSQLWSLLAAPIDLSKEVPPSRFNVKAFYSKDAEYHGTTDSPKAYWLEEDHRLFDATFFNITPKEAEAIDPQQRMILEVVYEALESAGYTLQQYAGTNVAVFAGVMTADFDTLSQRDELTTSRYYATGNARSIISNRVSYFFNFHGPSMTIDTACSSSLVAMHQAVLSLRSGESVMACVTGVNIMLTPEQFIVESNMHMLSPSGHCRMWDADADGYARGEGVAAMFLKPLSRALADGDRIEGIIRETGVNSDGSTSGITMPNAQAQSRLIQDVYRRTGLDPKDPEDRCQFFEAHGTGTHAGDPREAAAVEDVFFGRKDVVGHRHEASDPTNMHERELPHSPISSRLLVGSVKTVIGHTEGAAGLAGIMKVVLAMRQGTVPPNLHLENVNPNVVPFYSQLLVPTTAQPWPRLPPGQPRRASVNSFGFGGTNSHAIVEHYDPSIHDAVARTFSNRPIPWSLPNNDDVLKDSDIQPAVLPLLLSANSQHSLVSVAETYLEYMDNHKKVEPAQLGWHTYSRRTALPFKVSVSATTHEDLRKGLKEIVDEAHQSTTPSIGIRSRSSDGGPKILGIFTGQGAQWATMSKGLLQTSHVYRKSIHGLDRVLRQCRDPPSWTLEQEILAEESLSRVGKAAISQPLCTAVQLALIDLLRSIGITFYAVVGHSSGEIAAAYAAGRLTARDAMLISYYRGMYAHLAGGARGENGGMIAVGLSKQDAVELCARKEYRGGICVAANNAPSSVTLSGDLDVVQRVREDLSSQNIFARVLQVDTAYHSPHMEVPAAKYLEALASNHISPTEFNNGTVWVSSVYGMDEPSQNALESQYWRDNMVHPVLFLEAIRTALNQKGGFNFAIEVGPHPTLKGPVTKTITAVNHNSLRYVGLLERNKDDRLAFSEFIGTFWTQFGPTAMQLGPFVRNSSRSRFTTTLPDEAPSYPWDHSQIFYRESRISRQYHFRTQPPHELLGVRTRDDDQNQMRWRNILKFEKLPWIAGHIFQGQALLPASGYCVMAFDAAKVVLRGRPASLIELEDLEFLSGITVEPNSPGVEVMFTLTILPPAPGRRLHSTVEASIIIASAPADGLSPMKRNFYGKLRMVLGDPSSDALPPRPSGHAEAVTVSPEGFYVMIADSGLVYSGPFKGILELERRYNFSSARVRKRHADDTTALTLSPATLDSCLQSAFASFSSPGDKALWTTFLPTTIEKVRFNIAICEMAHTDNPMLDVDAILTKVKPITRESNAAFTVDIGIFNHRGQMEIQVEGLIVSSFAAARPQDDYELYLTTVMDIDPDEEIVVAPSFELEEPSLALVESCERVASFCLIRAPPRSPFRTPRASFSLGSDCGALAPSIDNFQNQWPTDTDHVIGEFISKSPHRVALDLIRTLGKNLPDVLIGMLPTIIEEAHQFGAFQEHLGRIARQIAHRYPRMNVLGLTDPEYALTEAVLGGLRNSFSTFTVGVEDKPAMGRISHSPYREKVIAKALNLEQTIDEDLAHYDLVILSASVLESLNVQLALDNLRRKMRPGAFFILIHVSRSPLNNRLRRAAGFQGEAEDMITPPDWPDVLDVCGFGREMRNAYQYYPPGFGIIIRQTHSSLNKATTLPLLQPISTPLTEHLLLVGGLSEHTLRLGRGICQALNPLVSTLTTVRTFEDIHPSYLPLFTAAIFLNDLDHPILSTLTGARLELLKSLLRPNMVILWVTHDARFGCPDHAASFGFARTLLAEVPNLVLRMLDLDVITNDSAVLIAEEFARLTLPDLTSARKDGFLWTHEPEVHIEKGHRLVPRVLSWTDANNRVNAPRRVVTTPVNTLDRVVRISTLQSRDGSSDYESKLVASGPQGMSNPGQITVRLDYSSVDALDLGWIFPSHVCVGRDLQTGAVVAVLSEFNASFVTIPQACALPLGNGPVNTPVFINLLVGFLTSLIIAGDIREAGDSQGMPVLLIDPDDMLLQCARDVFSALGLDLLACTPDVHKSRRDPGIKLLHLNSTSREIRAAFPSGGAHVFDFLPGLSKLSEVVMDSLPENCEYRSRYSPLTLGHLNIESDASVLVDIFEEAVAMALAKAAVWDVTTDAEIAPLLSVPELLRGPEQSRPFQIIDWKKERTIEHVITPLVEQQLLKPDKTYVLVGLTRDLGQSLCRLFIEHGARHLVVASRNPNRRPKWRQELAAGGVNILIETLDVTVWDDVFQFRERLAETMPPVGGIVNGAMLIEDRVFSEMSLETMNRVLLPKTVGSKNLSTVFESDPLDFFIMTSSFAAIGGHPGQSNYAAANMYMNGLAASRRNRGLPGSVLNIGVIYGLGFLHRERGELYAGLEREGYPPISERDVHHMFLEAIVAGRPSCSSGPKVTTDKQHSQVYDIVTGLKRFRFGSPDPLYWQQDARFSHFSVVDDTSDTLINNTGNSGCNQDVKERLEQAETVDAATETLLAPFSSFLEDLLQLPKGSVRSDHSLTELGVDSLVAVSIRSWILRTSGEDIAVLKILGSTSIAKLCANIAEMVISSRTAAGSKHPETEAPPVPGQVQTVLKSIDTGVAPATPIMTLSESAVFFSQGSDTAKTVQATPDPSAYSPKSVILSRDPSKIPVMASFEPVGGS